MASLDYTAFNNMSDSEVIQHYSMPKDSIDGNITAGLRSK